MVLIMQISLQPSKVVKLQCKKCRSILLKVHSICGTKRQVFQVYVLFETFCMCAHISNISLFLLFLQYIFPFASLIFCERAHEWAFLHTFELNHLKKERKMLAVCGSLVSTHTIHCMRYNSMRAIFVHVLYRTYVPSTKIPFCFSHIHTYSVLFWYVLVHGIPQKLIL